MPGKRETKTPTERVMQINPYLSFNGKCETAFKFYEKVLGGKILMMMKYGESPMATQTPPESKDNIMHARLAVGDMLLMGADAPPQFYTPMQGMVVTLGVETPAEADRLFNALAEGGTVRMPIQETFWARRFGMLIDQFGTPWMVNCERTS
jgi:PhnB protein